MCGEFQSTFQVLENNAKSVLSSNKYERVVVVNNRFWTYFFRKKKNEYCVYGGVKPAKRKRVGKIHIFEFPYTQPQLSIQSTNDGVRETGVDDE